MKSRFFFPIGVLLYVHTTCFASAATCNEFRSDMQAIQQQVRQIELNRTTSILDSVTQASQVVKGSCLDQLSSLDMAAFGLNPAAASVITKLANQACQKLSQQLAQKMNEARQRAISGVNNAVGTDISSMSYGSLSGGGAMRSAAVPTGLAGEPTMATQAASYVAGAWDRLKNFIMP